MKNRFKPATRQYLDTLIATRPGETKLGQRVEAAEGSDLEGILEQSKARFVLLGIPEDIGVRANLGVGGTQSLWEPALRAFLNVQYTSMLANTKILVLGAFDFAEEMKATEGRTAAALRELVPEIDEQVGAVVKMIVAAGKIPIVIGGGHNNAYPLLKGASLGLGSAVNCINLDAHTDYREMEGRHSGNGFRYAKHEGFLERYAVVGLHENYNAPELIELFNTDKDLHYSWYEDIFIDAKTSFYEAVVAAQQHVAGKPAGIELDMDCIENQLSSAQTPVGLRALQARQYVSWCAKLLNPLYFHSAEGATLLADGRKDPTAAKLAAYLVSDFIRGYQGNRVKIPG